MHYVKIIITNASLKAKVGYKLYNLDNLRHFCGLNQLYTKQLATIFAQILLIFPL